MNKKERHEPTVLDYFKYRAALRFRQMKEAIRGGGAAALEPRVVQGAEGYVETVMFPNRRGEVRIYRNEDGRFELTIVHDLKGNKKIAGLLRLRGEHDSMDDAKDRASELAERFSREVTVEDCEREGEYDE